eukprot:COSAG01_NODE_48668_length_379_cov_0.728571_1_plen_83_part_01
MLDLRKATTAAVLLRVVSLSELQMSSLRAVVTGLWPQSLLTPPGSFLDDDTLHRFVQTRMNLSQNRSAEQSLSVEQQSPASRN